MRAAITNGVNHSDKWTALSAVLSAVHFCQHTQTRLTEVKVKNSKWDCRISLGWPLTFHIILLGITLIREKMTCRVTLRWRLTDRLIINYRNNCLQTEGLTVVMTHISHWVAADKLHKLNKRVFFSLSFLAGNWFSHFTRNVNLCWAHVSIWLINNTHVHILSCTFGLGLFLMNWTRLLTSN